jgi:hypothetical protein
VQEATACKEALRIARRVYETPSGASVTEIDGGMAMSTRKLSTRRVLPDKEVGTEVTSYPRVRYWAKSHTHRVCGYGCGCRLPIPVYPRVRKTRISNSHPKSF